jgi:hypothetical protein
MPAADVSATDVLWYALSGFLVLVGVGLFVVLLRLAGTFGRLSSLVRGLEIEVLPVINKTGGTVDRVNAQLDKVDIVTTSAVDAADSVDTAIRAVTLAITRPVQKVSGAFAGLVQGGADLLRHRDLNAAVQAGREAKARRERDIAEELRPAGGRDRVA